MPADGAATDHVAPAPTAASPNGALADEGREALVAAVQALSMVREVDRVRDIVLAAARELVGADGASFVLRDGEQCWYVDEHAVAPLWKGRRFPLDACITGWVMRRRMPAVVADITGDERIPHEVYRPTFVRSLVAVPIRTEDPIGAIGVSWATLTHPTPVEVAALQALATATAVSLERLRAEDELARRLAELEHANRCLQDANRLLEHFASIVSHDLRSPLATIEGLIATVRERPGGELAASDRTLLDRARSQTRALSETVDALLGLGRVSGRALRVEPVDLTAVAAGVIEALRGEVEAAGALVEVGELPTLSGDRTLLRLLLQKLVVNALRFRHPDRTQVVSIDARRDQGAWRLTITDRGQGFDPEDAQAIFGLFARSTPGGSGAARDGLGIGLDTCRRIAERHGGTITAEPLATGARFVVTLPSWS